MKIKYLQGDQKIFSTVYTFWILYNEYTSGFSLIGGCNIAPTFILKWISPAVYDIILDIQRDTNTVTLVQRVDWNIFENCKMWIILLLLSNVMNTGLLNKYEYKKGFYAKYLYCNTHLYTEY